METLNIEFYASYGACKIVSMLVILLEQVSHLVIALAVTMTTSALTGSSQFCWKIHFMSLPAQYRRTEYIIFKSFIMTLAFEVNLNGISRE